MKPIKTEIIKQEYNYVKEEPWEGPIIPAAKVSPQVIQILRTTKVPQLIIPSHTTISGAAEIYYNQYLKLFSQNRKLNSDLIQIFEDRNVLAQKYNQLKVNPELNQREQNQVDQNIRRKRRLANQIIRDFSCPSVGCNKSYGSEGSLTQHVKLKHLEFYKSGEYQIILQKMIDQMSIVIKVKNQQQQQRTNKTPNKTNKTKLVKREVIQQLNNNDKVKVKLQYNPQLQNKNQVKNKDQIKQNDSNQKNKDQKQQIDQIQKKKQKKVKKHN